MQTPTQKNSFLVTGGNGYIGSHMCKILHGMGHEVVIIDNHSSSPEEPVHNYGTFYEGDIGDAEFVTEVLKQYQFSAVFHFAALSVVSESEAEPFRYFYNNSIQSMVFFETLIEHKIKNIVFSSTSSTYGNNMTLEFLAEDSPQNPSNAYAVSKKLVEDTLTYLAQKYSFNAAILRYFNVAGSDPALEIGENHEPESHLIPSLCLSFVNKQSTTFKLFGEDHPTPDGTCIRDYIHVEDLVRAHYLAYENFSKKPGVEIFNLGSGKGYSVKEVMKVFEEVTGAPLKFEVCPARKQDPPRLVCQIKKAKTELGFENRYTLKDAIQHTLNYLTKTRKRHPRN